MRNYCVALVSINTILSLNELTKIFIFICQKSSMSLSLSLVHSHPITHNIKKLLKLFQFRLRLSKKFEFQIDISQWTLISFYDAVFHQNLMMKKIIKKRIRQLIEMIRMEINKNRKLEF